MLVFHPSSFLSFKLWQSGAGVKVMYPRHNVFSVAPHRVYSIYRTEFDRNLVALLAAWTPKTFQFAAGCHFPATPGKPGEGIYMYSQSRPHGVQFAFEFQKSTYDMGLCMGGVFGSGVPMPFIISIGRYYYESSMSRVSLGFFANSVTNIPSYWRICLIQKAGKASTTIAIDFSGTWGHISRWHLLQRLCQGKQRMSIIVARVRGPLLFGLGVKFPALGTNWTISTAYSSDRRPSVGVDIEFVKDDRSPKVACSDPEQRKWMNGS
jgi:hypothetical protein